MMEQISQSQRQVFSLDIEHEQLGFHVTDDLTIAMIQETPWPLEIVFTMVVM
ncbi:hypothetical protein Ct9H90mP12_2990 [bacterium]|nr:MAG: hypothetical protein Ct9H90mP12_2990 [bacterium]